MKIFFTLSTSLLLLGALFTVQAQTVTVKPATEFIISNEAKGVQTVLYIDEKYVTKGWKEFLKEYGKVETPKGSKNVYSVAVGKMPNLSFAPIAITSKVTSSDGATTIFYSLKDDAAFITDPAHSKYSSAVDLLHDFGVRMYREQVNREVEVAQKELDKRIRTNEQLVRKGEGLQKDLEENKKDKINYDEQMVKNHNDSIQLVRDILLNKDEQKQTADAYTKQQTVMTSVKSSLDSAGVVYVGKKKKDMPVEIQASEKELKAREKERDKAIKNGESLHKDQEKNGRQKTDLQNKLAKNAADRERIPKEIEANLKEQKKAQEEIEKQKKVVEQVRAKLNDIK
ncbi:hypothetical protein QNI19_23055 [Cytophagaceae bacterium DM2B3-1]|uniref:Uncharacterized protein n=1 Tax=Xanthocytophaga flava TaxID=3048013 RepID=A0ABT7CQ19_9BACT|nr:hypothetical protein [Xanthocytophaga flavus]MDJ1471167.1 hypothetical protein [Xanthocytophaga flavus]MDJ1495833.1 hypothetical protein [Xanthocytophaga flavus]